MFSENSFIIYTCTCIQNYQSVIYRLENGFLSPLLPYAWRVLSEGIKVSQLQGIEVIN